MCTLQSYATGWLNVECYEGDKRKTATNENWSTTCCEQAKKVANVLTNIVVKTFCF